MNKISLLKPVILGFILIIIFVISVGVVLSQQDTQKNVITPPILPGPKDSIPTRPAKCVPLPVYKDMTAPNTPTPDRSKQTGEYPPSLSPSVTPYPVKMTVDLSPELALSDKAQIYVFRCNGDMELYLINPEADLAKTVGLNEGDIIYTIIPPATLMGNRPPENTLLPPTLHIPTTVTSMPYPAPNESGTKEKAIPYPVP
jgi:hypothetical protein